jgi:hypothetical protein
MDLKSQANSAMAREAGNLLAVLIDPHIPIELDEANGAAVADGHRFSYASGALVMLGFCAKCGQEVPSGRIRTLADLGQQMRDFRPARHDCMDVD